MGQKQNKSQCLIRTQGTWSAFNDFIGKMLLEHCRALRKLLSCLNIQSPNPHTTRLMWDVSGVGNCLKLVGSVWGGKKRRRRWCNVWRLSHSDSHPCTLSDRGRVLQTQRQHSWSHDYTPPPLQTSPLQCLWTCFANHWNDRKSPWPKRGGNSLILKGRGGEGGYWGDSEGF